MNLRIPFGILLVCAGLGGWLAAGEIDKAAPPRVPSDPQDPAASLGAAKSDEKAIRIDKEKKVVIVEGKICLDEGPLELFACAEGGKEYESLVAIRGEPWQLHLCLLLLGLKPGGGPRFQRQRKPIRVVLPSRRG